jgi:hypothetical protein
VHRGNHASTYWETDDRLRNPDWSEGKPASKRERRIAEKIDRDDRPIENLRWIDVAHNAATREVIIDNGTADPFFRFNKAFCNEWFYHQFKYPVRNRIDLAFGMKLFTTRTFVSTVAQLRTVSVALSKEVFCT